MKPLWSVCSDWVFLVTVGMVCTAAIAVGYWSPSIPGLPVLHDPFESLVGIWSVLVVVWILGLPTEFPEHVRAARYRGLWIGFVVTAMVAFVVIYDDYLAVTAHINGLNANRTDAVAALNQLPRDVQQLRASAAAVDGAVVRLMRASDTPGSPRDLDILRNDTLQLVARSEILSQDSAQAKDRLEAVADQGKQRAQAPTAAAADSDKKPTLSLDEPMLVVVYTGRSATSIETMVQGIGSDLQQAVEQPDSPARSALLQRLHTTISLNLGHSIDIVDAQAQRATLAAGGLAILPPTEGVYLPVVAINVVGILLPWLILLLFIHGRRDNLVRQIYRDLWMLDTGDPHGGGAGVLLERALGDEESAVSVDKLEHNSVETDPRVRRALQERTFSNIEYLLSLIGLTLLVTIGWRFVLYPEGRLGMALLVQAGATSQHLVSYVVGNLTVLTIAFLGAYLWTMNGLVWRYLTSDLYPSAFMQASEQMVTSFIFGLLLSVVVPLVLYPTGELDRLNDFPVAASQLTNSRLTGTVALIGVLAFFFTIFRQSFFDEVPGLMRTLLPVRFRDRRQLEISQLDGVDMLVEARLREEGIGTVQAMATCSIERLVRRTHFSTMQLVDWLDQSLLRLHADTTTEAATDAREASGAEMPAPNVPGVTAVGSPPPAGAAPRLTMAAFKALGVRTATDLLDMWQDQDLQTQIKQRRLHFDDPHFHEALRVICTTLKEDPNLVYVRNFQQAQSAARTVPAEPEPVRIWLPPYLRNRSRRLRLIG